MEVLGEFFSFAMIGLVNGLIYAVVALGFTLVLGVMQVINFTHGVLFAFGAYFAFTMQRYLNLPFWAGLIFAPIFVGVLGHYPRTGGHSQNLWRQSPLWAPIDFRNGNRP